MTKDTTDLGILLVGDPEPLMKLAQMGQLDALLAFRQIIIVDEMVQEIDRRYTIKHPDDPHRLKRWIDARIIAKRIDCPTTWLGDLVEQIRKSGEDPLTRSRTGKDLGLLATINFLSRERAASFQEHVTYLVEEGFVAGRLEVSNIEAIHGDVLLRMLNLAGHRVPD